MKAVLAATVYGRSRQKKTKQSKTVGNMEATEGK